MVNWFNISQNYHMRLGWPNSSLPYNQYLGTLIRWYNLSQNNLLLGFSFISFLTFKFYFWGNDQDLILFSKDMWGHSD